MFHALWVIDAPSRLAEECGAQLIGVAEEGILEELRSRIMEGKGKVSMPQVRTYVDETQGLDRLRLLK